MFYGCSLTVLWLKPKNSQRTAIEHAENERLFYGAIGRLLVMLRCIGFITAGKILSPAALNTDTLENPPIP
jgi:hypothetical protein